jgi:hypothetical protein
MKEKESKRAFIFFPLFLGIGTFQRVLPDSNKKFPWVTRRLEGGTLLNPAPGAEQEDRWSLGNQ